LPPPAICTLCLHDALPIWRREDAGAARRRSARRNDRGLAPLQIQSMHFKARSSVALADATLQANLRKFQSTGFTALRAKAVAELDRKSTRLNSSHQINSYA